MRWKNYFFYTCFFIFSAASFASNTPQLKIKIAVLNNFNLQKSIVNRYNSFYVDKYEKAYLPGLELARNKAEKNGYEIIYKQFGYDRTPLGILKTIDSVTQWNPDVIIGPTDSNIFLLLSNYFHGTLVISPFATSDDVEKMPRNFYSTTAPVKYTARAIADYLDINYKNNGVFGIIELNCKNCVDLSKNFFVQERYKRAIHYEYISSDIMNNQIFDRVSSVKKADDIFFLPNTSYLSAVLISKITPLVHGKAVFIGGDGWGPWEQTHIRKIKTLGEYTAIRVTPWSLDIKSRRVDKFKKEYLEFYGTPASDVTPYIAYNAVDSIIQSLIDCRNKFSQSSRMHYKILTCYMDSLNRNKNWFRPSDYAIYNMGENGQKIISVIHVNLGKG